MATRSLTEVFILMRNNAVQSRNFYAEQNLSDKASLVRHEGEDGSPHSSPRHKLPPEWADSLDEAQYTLSKIKGRVKELGSLHSKHLLRPTFDDSSAEERQINTITEEITKMFGACQRCIQKIQQCSFNYTRGSQEALLAKNVVTSLVTSLQSLSNDFRQEQSAYLNKIKSREERSQQYFGEEVSSPNYDQWVNFGEQENSRSARVMTQQQLLQLEESTAVVEQRDKEIQQVVKSIVDLNTMFRDIAHMVADQGTVLDRIDFNVEHAEVKVHEGLVQLQKAEGYQKKNRKMMCIMILAVSVILLIILLIVVKS
nr:EOG090X0AQP [Eulimnadia texana]